MIEELEKEYDGLKDVIEILPIKTKDAKSRKQKLLDEEKEKDKKRISNIKREIEKRLQVFNNLHINPDIENLKKEKETCNIMNEWNEYNTSYEKMHLDYYLYQLHRYYKEDLKSVNECLNRLIETFKRVDITLSKEDFDFNEYAQDYMDKVIMGASKEELKVLFESYYWKNPDFIKILEANFKSIYYRYEKQINKFYDLRHQEFLSKHKDNEIYDLRLSLTAKIDNLINNDAYINFNNFINGTYSLGEFKDIDKIRNKYFENNAYNHSEVLELRSVLCEYDIIIKYKYLLNTIKDKLEKRENIKDIKANTLKEIYKNEVALKKFNNKKNKKPLFGRFKKPEKKILEYNSIIKKIIEAYDELDSSCFDNLIYLKLTNESTILEALKLITSNYLFFVTKTLEQDENQSIIDINSKFEELKSYILDNKLYLLNNIALLDEKQIKQLIVDKYNLNNISLTQENLLNLDSTFSDINLMLSYNNIISSGIKLEDVNLYIEYEKFNKE